MLKKLAENGSWFDKLKKSFFKIGEIRKFSVFGPLSKFLLLSKIHYYGFLFFCHIKAILWNRLNFSTTTPFHHLQDHSYEIELGSKNYSLHTYMLLRTTRGSYYKQVWRTNWELEFQIWKIFLLLLINKL